MATLMIQFSEEEERRLHELARQAGTTPEELVRARVAPLLDAATDDFQEAAAYVLNKNVELYRRLSRPDATPGS